MTRAVEIQATSLCNLVRQFTRHAHMGCILLPLISSNSLWVPALRTPSGLQMRVLGFTLIHLRVKPSLPGKEVRSQARWAGREKSGAGVSVRLSRKELGLEVGGHCGLAARPSQTALTVFLFAFQPSPAARHPTQGGGSAATCN